MAVTWLRDAKTQIYSMLKEKGKELLEDTYPNIYFTKTDSERVEPTFPTVYVNFLKSNEVGKDLRGLSLNGINMQIQLEVTTNVSDDEAEDVMFAILGVAVEDMGFKVDVAPQSMNLSTYRNVAVISRVIGANEPSMIISN